MRLSHLLGLQDRNLLITLRLDDPLVVIRLRLGFCLERIGLGCFRFLDGPELLLHRNLAGFDFVDVFRIEVDLLDHEIFDDDAAVSQLAGWVGELRLNLRLELDEPLAGIRFDRFPRRRRVFHQPHNDGTDELFLEILPDVLVNPNDLAGIEPPSNVERDVHRLAFGALHAIRVEFAAVRDLLGL